MRFRRFVIGTAGHVDHGKTTLVRALTGVDTDRLPEEKRRGISIELGFAPWHVADDLEATIIDVPGHRRLVHTMIAGASGIELVLMVIAADEGVMPQTREHARVCEELRIKQAVVVLTKSELVDAETLAIAEAEARELLAPRFDLDVVACSATRGTGLPAVRAAIAERLRKLAPLPTSGHASGPARLWVDRVLSVRGAGTVVTGTLVSGAVTRGEQLVLLGSGPPHPVTARELRVHERAFERVEAPARLAVNLPIAASEARRGDLLTSDGDLRTTNALDAELRGAGVRRGASVALHVGTAHVAARVTRAEPLADGAQLVRLALEEHRPIAGGDRFLIRGSAGEEGSLLGGGTALDARPHPRSRGEARRALLGALRAGDTGAVLTALLAEVAPHPLEVPALHGRLAVDHAALAALVDAEVARGELAACGGAVLTRATLAALADRARSLVMEHARRAPLDRGLPLATLHQKLADRAGPEAAEAAVRAARARRSPDDTDAIAVEDDVAIPALGSRQLDPALVGAAERARAELRAAGVHGVSATRIAEVSGAPSELVRALLASLERQSVAVRAGDLWFAQAVVDDLQARLVEHLARTGRLTVIEFKGLGGLPRKQAVLLLEHFDQVGVTRRVGEARVLLRAG